MFLEPKYDGWFARVEIAAGAVSIYSRSGRLLEHGPCEAAAPDVVLYAELLTGTEWSARDPGRLVAFDLEAPGTYSERRRALAATVAAAGWPRLTLAPSFPAAAEAAVWADYVTGQGFEGLVYKSEATAPGSYDRKKKTLCTWDFVVTGLVKGAGGVVRSLKISAYRDGALVRCGRVASLPREVKDLAAAAPESVLGQVVEVAGQSRTPRGAVRHPRFLRWRDDKPAHDCRADADGRDITHEEPAPRTAAYGKEDLVLLFIWPPEIQRLFAAA